MPHVPNRTSIGDLTPPPQKVQAPRHKPVTRKPALCPQCGSRVRNWWQDNPADPGDVDPRADCTNPSCGWGY